MIDIILGLVIVAILALAIGYIVRAKRAGVRCIGCSSGGCSSASSHGSCGCDHTHEGGCGCGGDCSCSGH